MEVALRLATARPFGGPVGTGERGERITVEVRELLYPAMANVLLVHSCYCKKGALEVHGM